MWELVDTSHQQRSQKEYKEVLGEDEDKVEWVMLQNVKKVYMFKMTY